MFAKSKETFLNAVNEVCKECVCCSETTCQSCPIHQSVDSLYSFAPFEIWIAKEYDSCWKNYVEPTKQFFADNVDGDFTFESYDLFYNTLWWQLIPHTVSSWYWVFINGELVTYGAMEDSDLDCIKGFMQAKKEG